MAEQNVALERQLKEVQYSLSRANLLAAPSTLVAFFGGPVVMFGMSESELPSASVAIAVASVAVVAASSVAATSLFLCACNTSSLEQQVYLQPEDRLSLLGSQFESARDSLRFDIKEDLASMDPTVAV